MRVSFSTSVLRICMFCCFSLCRDSTVVFVVLSKGGRQTSEVEYLFVTFWRTIFTCRSYSQRDCAQWASLSLFPSYRRKASGVRNTNTQKKKKEFIAYLNCSSLLIKKKKEDTNNREEKKCIECKHCLQRPRTRAVSPALKARRCFFLCGIFQRQRACREKKTETRMVERACQEEQASAKSVRRGLAPPHICIPEPSSFLFISLQPTPLFLHLASFYCCSFHIRSR